MGTMRKRLIYTALIGNYERPIEQPVFPDLDGFDKICFTDNSDLRSDTWQVVQVERPYRRDPVRSARHLKIVGHPLVDEYDESLWIDNRVRLLDNPAPLFDKTLVDADLALPFHSFRDQVRDEFTAVLESHMDDPRKIREQLFEYEHTFPDALAAKPLWTAILLRRNSDAVRRFSRRWMGEILRFSRRDQLSVCAALELEALPFHAFDVDNIASEWHEWVDESEMDRDMHVSRWGHEEFTYTKRMAISDASERLGVSPVYRRVRDAVRSRNP